MTGPEASWPADRFLNRELSALDFNERVLSLAEDDFTPLLERLKFVAIFASNMDEFFMVRVAGLKQQVAAGLVGRSSDGIMPRDLLGRIAEKVPALTRRHADLFAEDLKPALNKAGIEVLRYEDLQEEQSRQLERIFLERIFPIVTPLAVDPGHPFPYISNLSCNLAVLVRDPHIGRSHFARVKVPPLIPRFLELEENEEKSVFVPLEDVIAANLQHLFSGMEIIEHHVFRVTRNADLEVNDDAAEDLLQALEDELRKRRFSPAVRLEIEPGMPDYILELLMRELQVAEQDVYTLPGPLDLTSLWQLYELDRPDMKDEPFQPVTQPLLSTTEDGEPNMFSVLDEHDVLVHHPYDSFNSSVQYFIEQAAADPNVLAIKQTVYRTSGESPIVDALIEAAESGKQVVVLVEIKARFDEKANINWARTLERAGCHVVYGLVGLKTHCKLCLVVRRENGRLRRYAHVGTGNYNPKTAGIYEDIGLLTSDPQLSSDIGDLFNFLTGYSRHTKYRNLIVAPLSMREGIVDLIEKEAADSTPEAPGRIVIKVNGLADEKVIDALYAASGKGVQIDLICRGICALRPGVPGLSENIRVRSILGRFLEHSRVYYFQNGAREEMYFGSADLLHRNLDRRVEALARVKDVDLMERIKGILDLALADNSSAWILGSDCSWHRASPDEEEVIDHQKELMRRSASVRRD